MKLAHKIAQQLDYTLETLLANLLSADHEIAIYYVALVDVCWPILQSIQQIRVLHLPISDDIC